MRSLLIVILVGSLMGCVAPSKEVKNSFVGDYYAPQPCSLGSDFDLNLRTDGSYRMIRTLPEGVGPEMPEGTRAGYEEVGRWSYDGTAVTLEPETGKRLKLIPTYREEVLVLADTEMFGLRLERQKPNQPPQRNAGSRRSSHDSPASETPSSLGPRG